MKEHKLKTTAVVITGAVLIFFGFNQQQAYQSISRFNKEQIQLNSLKEKMIYYDDALTMSARAFASTHEQVWLERYQGYKLRFDSTFREVYRLAPEILQGGDKLKMSTEELYRLEDAAFQLIQLHEYRKAQELLFSDAYKHQQNVFQSGVFELTGLLDRKSAQLLTYQQRHIVQNSFLMIALGMLIFLSWYRFIRASKKWHIAVHDSEYRRAEAAVAAEKELQTTNLQLQELAGHLQQVRDKERLAVAYEINEELGQQLAAIKMQIDMLKSDGGSLNRSENLQQISVQLSESLIFMNNMAADAYPLVLRDLGLIEAMEWETNRFNKRKTAVVYFIPHIDHVDVDDKTASTLFWIFRERLHAAELAGATEINVIFTHKDSQLEMTIYDNRPGKEISIEDIAIEERARSINAGCRQDYSPEDGNFITITCLALQ